MEVFTYNPKNQREPLEAFNERVANYCEEYPVVAIDVSMVGPTLLLSLTLADDVDQSGWALTAVTMEIDGNDKTVEDTLTSRLDSLSKRNKEDHMFQPVKAVAVSRSDLPSQGFVVFLIANGTCDEEPEDD